MKPLDRESKGIYYIDVLASNDEADYTVIRNRRRRATDPSILTLKIIVGDINDLAPVFLQDEYYGCKFIGFPLYSFELVLSIMLCYKRYIIMVFIV